MDEKTPSPKFSELLPAYIAARKRYDRAEEKLEQAKQELESAGIEVAETQMPLVAAMKSRGVQSLREHSWDGFYFYLLPSGTLERREISGPNELDAEPEPLEASHV